MADWIGNNPPVGWTITTLADACEIIMGQSPPSSTYNDEGIGLPFFQGKAEFGDMYPTTIKWCSAPNKIAEAEDVLISVRAPVGPTNLARERSAIGRGLAALHPELGMPSRFFLYQLRHLEEELASKATGTTFAAISKSILEAQQILLAPLNEQYRIVDEIEAQFSRLDTWLEVMQKLREQLPRLRASILRAAVEGRLVPQEPEDESAEILLQHILGERRQKWEAEYVENLKTQGKPLPLFDDWKEKYQEPLPPDFGDSTDVPELPDGWVWASLSQLSAHEDDAITDGPFGSKLKTSHYTESGVRVIRLQNIGEGSFIDDDKAFISLEHYNTLLKHSVFPNDLVIAALGDSLPRACIIPDGLGSAIVKADCMRFKPHPELAVTDYMNAALNSETVKRIAAKKIHGIGRPRLNQAEIKSLPIPVAPYSQQLRIAADIAQRLSIIGRLLETIEVNIKRAERMRQSVLKKAFEGRLVEQDLNEESASELLLRIREERNRREEEEKQKPKQERERKVTTEKTGTKPLYDTLKMAGKPMSAHDLFQQAGFTHETIDEFYEELRAAVHELQTIRTRQNKNNEIFLEVTG